MSCGCGQCRARPRTLNIAPATKCSFNHLLFSDKAPEFKVDLPYYLPLQPIFFAFRFFNETRDIETMLSIQGKNLSCKKN